MKKWILEKEKELAKSLLKRKLAREGEKALPDATIEREAEKVVDEANKILKDRSKRAFNELKEAAKSLWKEGEKH